MRLLASAAVAGLLLAGCTSGSGDAAAPTPAAPTRAASSLDFTDCGGGFECATLTVPLDRSGVDPGEERLAVVRLPASGGGEPLGTVVLNPGGPGASGVEYARAAEFVLPEEILERFDVVGFDPRGVAGSGVVECLDPELAAEYLAADPTPDDEAEAAQLDAVATEVATACSAAEGVRLAHLSTADTVRDLDDLRAALGDEQLTYVGKSYGTLIGLTYAALFPDRVRALVLDGVVDPSLSQEVLDDVQAAGFESSFDEFLLWCEAERSGCGLGPGGLAPLRAAYAELAARIDADPLPAGDGRLLTEGLLSYGTATGLYSPSQGWPAIEAGLRQAVAGDGTGLLALADAYAGRLPDGGYDHSTEASVAVNCLDRPPYVGGAASYDERREALAVTAPNFGPLNVLISQPCLDWPVAPVELPFPAGDGPPLLLVGGTGDPATPYSWATAVADRLPGSRLLTFDGGGHTVYGDGTSPCIDEAVNAYLLEQRLPEEGTVCT